MSSIIFDAHCHVWPDKIAAKALAGRVSFMEAGFDGTVSGLETSLERCGIDKTVVMGIADHARHVHRTNEFIGALNSARMIPFGTVHPELSVEENLDSLRRNNVVGVKLHPLFQKFRLDDERIWALLEAFGDEIPVIAHVGKGGTPETDELATPQMIADIADNFPELRLVATHFGGFHRFDEANELVVGKNVVLETSWPPTLSDLQKERVVETIRRHGVHRVVFGSDWPMSDPAVEMDVVRNLGLTTEEVDGILGENLNRWINGENIKAAQA
ncbi:amidohydrolase family protein [Granulicoccus phenolivorans]|uniref:amidohydrolase family protein n=1 Tax=Granulicoccus phenolivorans TaxID=266854 RepID=UPI0003FF9248|nr:amidohydrolase family protein [Granulicoccus phenolivorans]